MSPRKSALAAIVAVAGISTSAHAQAQGLPVGPGAGDGYYSVSGGYGDYGVLGVHPYYGGHVRPVSPRGRSLNAPTARPAAANPPKPAGNGNGNMDGLIRTIREQAGRPNAGGTRAGRGR